jgi:hypothetical protein
VTGTETGHITGTADKDYNIIWFTEHCLNNVLRLETFIKDAERSGRRPTCATRGARPRTRTRPAAITKAAWSYPACP